MRSHIVFSAAIALATSCGSPPPLPEQWTVAARLPVPRFEAYAATWASVDAPMGGWGDSGLGRRHGSYGVLKYTEPQTVSVQRFHPIAPPWFMSNQTYAKLLTAGLHVLRRIPRRG